MPVEDSYVAAITLRRGLTIATRNDRPFKRPWLDMFNRFKEAVATPRRHKTPIRRYGHAAPHGFDIGIIRGVSLRPQFVDQIRIFQQREKQRKLA
jgi:hypothetical protein